MTGSRPTHIPLSDAAQVCSLFTVVYKRIERGMFLAKPRSWGVAPRFEIFQVKFTVARTGAPRPPTALELRVLPKYFVLGGVHCQGGRRGRDWCSSNVAHVVETGAGSSWLASPRPGLKIGI